jgi:hypothetical protein
MPYPADVKYPAIATNAAWQKKKSTLDKLHKTHVGPKLVEAARTWGLIKWQDLDDRKQSTTIAMAKDRLQKAQAAYPAVLTARDAVKDALDTATTQSRNAKLNSTSRQALTDIAKALKEAHTRLDRMSDIIATLTVDSNITAKAALGTLKNLEIKSGSKVIAWAKSAKLVGKVYEVEDVDWKVPTKLSLDYLQKKVSVSAHDGNGMTWKEDRVIAGISGDDKLKLK